MECRYCKALNEADEHRCSRCGRRLHGSVARSAPDTYPITTATAPSLNALYESVARDAGPAPAVAEREPEPVPQRAVYQRALFQEMQRVVLLPSRSITEVSRPRSVAPRPVRPRRHADIQQSLFSTGLPQLEAPAETAIYCDAPVALPVHRVLASLLDTAMILAALGLFLATFLLAGGEMLINQHTLGLFAGIAAVLGLFYHFLFCICGGDTAGMQWTQLRLVNFDGQIPDREQRVSRLVGSCLSLLAAGLGLVWALVDEESLTWHDHISKTFPSPYQSHQE